MLDDRLSWLLAFAGQRHEAFDMHRLARQAGSLERGHRPVHERPRAANEGLGLGEAFGKGRQLLGQWSALDAVQPMDDLQPRRVMQRQLTQQIAEDHRVFIAIGIDQANPPAARRQRCAQDRQHRRDAAAAGEQQQVSVQRLRHEHAGRRQHLHAVAGAEPVAQPVGAAAVGDALDRHAQRLVVQRAAGQRIAARQPVVTVRYAQGEELAGAITEALRQRRGHVEDERAAVGGFVNHLSHGESEVFGRVHAQILMTNWPLSMRSSMPLMARASSDARNTMALATSSGRQARFIGSASMVNRSGSTPAG